MVGEVLHSIIINSVRLVIMAHKMTKMTSHYDIKNDKMTSHYDTKNDQNEQSMTSQ